MLISVLPVLLASCEGIDPFIQAEPASLVQPASRPDADYLLGSGDKLRVIVFAEPSLSGEFQVGVDGAISMPLVGQISAAGLTPRVFSDHVSTALRNGYLRNPRVSVEVLSARPFYVLGEVNKPGDYPYRDGTNALSVVAVAGGYTPRANTRVVYIRRVNDPAERTFVASPSTPVFPGDIVRVPERYF